MKRKRYVDSVTWRVLFNLLYAKNYCERTTLVNLYLTVICVDNRVIGKTETKLKSLILAQNERWRQASYMQVERPFGGVADG